MNQAQKAREFADLHQPGQPLLLYNIWDAGGARAIAEAGARAIATGSASVAAAHGYEDGEQIPLDLVVPVVSRITQTTPLPVTVDFEGGYAEAPEAAAGNVVRIIDAGAVGINFEDQIVGGTGLYSIQAQCDRISALRQAALTQEVPLFINARTDLFLKQSDRARHGDLIAEVRERATAYAEAGGNSLFVPGLVNPKLIGSLCEQVALPINIMMMDGAPSVAELASLGVARISCGPGPYRSAIAGLKEGFRQFSGG